MTKLLGYDKGIVPKNSIHLTADEASDTCVIWLN